MPSRKSIPTPTAGRPRSPEARRAVLDAARSLLDKHGYAATTIEAIALKSGVAKTTIYRGWQNRAALLIELLVEIANEEAPPPSRSTAPLQSLRTELRLGAIAMGGTTGKLLTSLLGEAQQDPAVRTALLDSLFYPRREASVNAIKQAQARGELRADVPPHVAVDLLFGPLFYRMFVQHEPVTEQFMKHALRFTLEGLATTA